LATLASRDSLEENAARSIVPTLLFSRSNAAFWLACSSTDRRRASWIDAAADSAASRRPERAAVVAASSVVLPARVGGGGAGIDDDAADERGVWIASTVWAVEAEAAEAAEVARFELRRIWFSLVWRRTKDFAPPAAASSQWQHVVKHSEPSSPPTHTAAVAQEHWQCDVSGHREEARGARRKRRREARMKGRALIVFEVATRWGRFFEVEQKWSNVA
jgi:hypothetical protein